MSNNNKDLRKKRDQIQQWTISICSLVMLVFILAWVVNIALKGSNLKISDTSSKVKPAQAKVSSVVDETSSVIDETSSVADTSSSADTSSNSKNDGYDDFNDAVFIGDSRTVGLGMNTDRPKATFYAATGLNVSSVADSATIMLDNGNYGTVYDALKQKQFNRVYVSFGINELGWPYLNVFQEQYEVLINKIKEIQPDATIYVQSILPVSSLAISTNAVFTNENIINMNSYVKNIAANTNSIYIDSAQSVMDENGALPLEASTDGIHLIRDYCSKWMEYLADNS